MKLYEPFQFLSAEECDRIIEYGKKSQIEDAKNPAKLWLFANTEIVENTT